MIRWQSPGKSVSQQQIKAIYPNTLQMLCTVLISVNFCISLANSWPGSNWRFWSNPVLIVPNDPIITGTTTVLNFHILLTSFSRSSYLLSFSVSFVFTFKLLVWLYQSVGKSSLFLSSSAILGWFASIVRSMITYTIRIRVVPLTFMTLSGMCLYHLSVTCNPICLHIIQWM